MVQINRASWDVTDEQAFDPEFSLRFAAEKLSKGEEHHWVVCNCYAYAKLFMKLPRMAEIIPNSIHPRLNGLVVMNYSGVKHIAVITKVVEDGIWVKEANYDPCAIGSRLIKWTDKAIRGYYSPAEG